jgi:hypothetical protein
LKQNKAVSRSGLRPADSAPAIALKNAPQTHERCKPASMLIKAIRFTYNRFLSVKVGCTFDTHSRTSATLHRRAKIFTTAATLNAYRLPIRYSSHHRSRHQIFSKNHHLARSLKTSNPLFKTRSETRRYTQP